MTESRAVAFAVAAAALKCKNGQDAFGAPWRDAQGWLRSSAHAVDK